MCPRFYGRIPAPADSDDWTQTRVVHARVVKFLFMPMYRQRYRHVTVAGTVLAASLATAPLIDAPLAHAADSVTFAQKATTTASSSTKSAEKKAEKTSPAKPTSSAPAAPKAPIENYSGGPITDWGKGVEERMATATEAAKKNGATLGLAILDRKTGEFICNSECDQSFVLASLSKVFIAETVGYTNYTPPKKGDIIAGEGEMPVEGNVDAMARDDMMRYSNNEYTLQLWNRYGATNIITSAKDRYGLSDSTIADPDWGMTKSSPADLVRLFDGILKGKGGMSEEETDYLISLMYSLPRYSYGNADQSFGIRAGLPGETVGQKGGWYDPQTRTSAGFFGDDERYVMAALGSNVGVNGLTDAVHTVFPSGVVRPDEADAHNHKPATLAQQDSAVLNRYSPMWLILVAALGFVLGWLVRHKTEITEK